MPIRLPQTRFSQAPQSQKRDVPIDQILQVMGGNPYAKAIDNITPILSKALEERAQARKEAEGVGALEGAYGMAPGSLKGLPLTNASVAAKDIYDINAKKTMAGGKSSSGGYYIPRGIDPKSGRPVYSDSKRIGLFYDDNTPYYGGAPGALNLKAQPSDQLQKETDLSTLAFSLDKVKNSYNRDFVGPVGSRVGKGKQYVEGMATPEATDFYSNASDLRNQLVYLRSGKQINEEEYKRLLSAVPNENMSPTDFEQRLKNFEQLLGTIKSSRTAALSGSGYRTTAPRTLAPLPKRGGSNDPLGLR